MRTGITRSILSLTAGAVLLPALAAPARAGDRVTLAVSGGLSAGTIDWTSRASWDAWAETASLDARHEAASGTTFQGALGVRFSEHLGVVLAGGMASRDAKASLQAEIPHPLVLDSPRAVTGEVSGLDYSELAFHLDLEWRTLAGPFELAVFAGPTLARVETDVVESVSATEAYPYDEAPYESANATSVTSKTGFGFNVGASAAWLALSHLDLGVEARYVRASVDLEPSFGDAFSLNAGGIEVVGRLRVRF